LKEKLTAIHNGKVNDLLLKQLNQPSCWKVGLESWMGMTAEYRTMDSLCEDLLREGLGCIRTRYLGDKQVILTGEDGVQFKDTFHVNKEVLAQMFEIL